MRPLARKLAVWFGLAATLILASLVLAEIVSAYNPSVLVRMGMNSEDVRVLQDMLNTAGFAVGERDGVFGPATLRAVKSFQLRQGLTADGVVGATTWSRLQLEVAKARTRSYVVRPGDTLSDIASRFEMSVRDLARMNGIADPSSIMAGRELRIPPAASRGAGPLAEVLGWEAARGLFSGIATVTDVRTGLSFRVKRRGGHFHADAEPLTATDAATMKKVCGGKWSWERRPIIVQVGAREIAASMNGMPHGGESVRGNGFSGHFCIHFAGSKLHATGKVDPEHQSCVREAAGLK